MWPFKTEYRQEALSDLVVSRLIANAEGAFTVPTATAAHEIGAGLWARAFGGATVTGSRGDVLTPVVMASVGRALFSSGNWVAEIVVRGGRIHLEPISEYDVSGGPDRSSWVYRTTRPGPSQSAERTLHSSRLVHIMIGVDPSAPWRGRGPLQIAQLTSGFGAKLETRLSEEANAPTGQIVPTPTGQNLGALATDIAGLKGRLTMIESTSGGWGKGRSASPGNGNSDLRPNRVGPMFDLQESVLRDSTSLQLLAAAGIPAGVLGGTDASGLREGWRLFVLNMASVGRIALDELRDSLDAPGLDFDWTPLRSSDELTGRARSFKSLVEGGMAVTEAAALSGILVNDS